MSMTLMVDAMKAKVGNPLRKLVLIKLADNASDDGRCWPSYKHVADQCEISRSAVKTHIKELEKAGFLTIEHRRTGLQNQTNIFHLSIKKGTQTPGQDLTHPGQEIPQGVGQEMPEGGAGDNPPRSGDDREGGAGADPGTSHSFEPVKEPVSEPGMFPEDDPRPDEYRKLSLAKVPEGIPTQSIKDFIDFRRAMKDGRSFTEHALKICMNAAARAPEYRLTPEQVIDETIARGWKKPEPQWVQNKIPQRQSKVSKFPSGDPWGIPKSTDEEAMERDMAAVEEHLRDCI